MRGKHFYVSNIWYVLRLVCGVVFSSEGRWIFGIGPRPSCSGSETYASCNLGACGYHGWIEQGFNFGFRPLDSLAVRRARKEN